MTTPLPPYPPRTPAVQRWGPLALLTAGLVVVGALAATSDGSTASADEEAQPASTEEGIPAPTGLMPVTWDEAVASGTEGDHTWTGCDESTGRVMLPSIYAAPCVPAFDGDNGGDTYRGVTADTITVAVYIPAQDNDLTAMLQGLADDPVLSRQVQREQVEALTDIYETYGRTVELVEFQASGAADDETAARADAREVAQDIGAFASLGSPLLTGAYAEELAAQGVLCLGCGTSSPDAFFQANSPYIWGSGPTAEQFLPNIGDYLAYRLFGKPAEFAGDPAMRERERTFGFVHFEQETPVFGETTSAWRERGEEVGLEAAAVESYTFDLAKMPERAPSIIAKMIEADVTSIVFLGDPLMPIFLAQEATKQDYYPEWIVTGTVLTDTTALGRLYPQEQWAHAFGLSNLAVRIPRELGDPYRIHEWYWGEPPAAPTGAQLSWPSVHMLMLGIHLAGPDLTPETFRDGLFRYPPSGGGATAPRISYGNHGVFDAPDHLGVDDATIIWWDAEGTGTDEAGQEGTGVYRYVDGGQRYLPGEITAGDPGVFVEEGSVATMDEPAPGFRPPEYPSPERGAGLP